MAPFLHLAPATATQTMSESVQQPCLELVLAPRDATSYSVALGYAETSPPASEPRALLEAAGPVFSDEEHFCAAPSSARQPAEGPEPSCFWLDPYEELRPKQVSVITFPPRLVAAQLKPMDMVREKLRSSTSGSSAQTCVPWALLLAPGSSGSHSPSLCLGPCDLTVPENGCDLPCQQKHWWGARGRRVQLRAERSWGRAGLNEGRSQGGDCWGSHESDGV